MGIISVSRQRNNTPKQNHSGFTFFVQAEQIQISFFNGRAVIFFSWPARVHYQLREGNWNTIRILDQTRWFQVWVLLMALIIIFLLGWRQNVRK